ncbi:MAG: hypothetical protein Q8O87_03950 [bacterium]|nr:hypothetical protein [bacterium]
MASKLWSDQEVKTLKSLWASGASDVEIDGALPGRSVNAWKKRARKLELGSRPATPADAKLSHEDVGVEFGDRMRNLFGEETLKIVKLPQISARKSYVIPHKSGDITVINSPLIGSLTPEDDETDIVKNALRLAEAFGDDAVVVTGNLMYMLTQRYSTLRPFKAQVSGVKVDPKKVEAGYPKSVTEEDGYESVEERRRKGEPIFMTLGLRLQHNIDLLARTFTGKDGKPLYNGPVYITFGKLEDELIMYYANEFLRVGFYKSRGWAQKMVYKYTAAWRSEKDPAAKAELYKKVKDFREFLNIFLIMGNTVDESIETGREIATGYIIRKYEEYIPNAKVISVGDAFVKTDSRLAMITTDKYRNTNKNLGATLAEHTESFSKGRRHISIPNVMLGSGLNPFFETRWVTYQASEKPGDERMCAIIQLPICIDAERYRNVIRNQNILKDLITRTGQTSGFESGVVRLRWHEGVAQPITEFWSSDLLKNAEIFGDPKNIAKLVRGNDKRHKVMYAHKLGCTHYGANDIWKHPSGDPNRPVKYLYQIIMEFLMAAKAPILANWHDGDITQQANHPYAKNVNPNSLLPELLIDKMNEIRGASISEQDKVQQLMVLALTQRINSGVLQLDEQVRGYALSLRPYLKYFLDIIARRKKVGLVFKGNLASIMHIMGNHCKNTFKHSDVFVSDASHITEQLKKLLLIYLSENKYPGVTAKDIDRELAAPQHGPLGEARGSFGVEGYQGFATVLMHKQGKMPATKKASMRRSLSECEVGKPIVNLSGDDHKGGVMITRGIINIKTGSQQGEGSYGREINGSPQNHFSMVFGLPVGGLSDGPVVFVTLDAETMRRYADKPFPLDGKKLFRNALK